LGGRRRQEVGKVNCKLVVAVVVVVVGGIRSPCLAQGRSRESVEGVEAEVEVEVEVQAQVERRRQEGC
jgi:hypothetical protein